jgi:tight adherence protein C
MTIFLLVGLFFTAFAVAMVARAVAMPRVRSAGTLEQIDAYGFAGEQAEPAAPRGVRVTLDGVASILGGALAPRLGALRESELRTILMGAGLYRISPRQFLGYRVLSAICAPAALSSTAVISGASGLMVALAFPVAALAGWSVPLTLVRRRAQRRFQKIDYDLPELIDLLVVTVEAGLGFSGSLQIASNRLGGPLGDELRLALQEQRMGLSTNEALRNMLLRCETPAMRSFVRSVLQGETLGVSIGEIMRSLATEMRKRRRLAAEERAQKAPVKLLFPLIFLIFPAMFVVLLGPALFQFIEAFGGGG